MLVETVEAVVVGAGQAGIAMSEHLGKSGISHVVLERHRVAEAWRSARWDSLVANGPAWHDRFPGLALSDTDPDHFAPKERVADYFEAYAAHINAPVRCGVDVVRVSKSAASGRYLVETSAGNYETRNVIAATGPFQVPVIPPVVPQQAPVHQIHSMAYRNPAQLPQGAVVVVGSGSSGVQIAEELLSAGRRVYLSVGPHERPPRAYRGRDFVWWLGVLGKWDQEAPGPGTEHVTIAVSGAHGGQTIDFRRLAHRGMTLVGRTKSFHEGALIFAQDLATNLARGDASYLSLLDEADDYAELHNLDLPIEPLARKIDADPDCVTNPILSLHLAGAGITSIIWATGFATDYSWLKAGAFDARGRPAHRRGISPEPGIYFLGLPWQTRRGSSFIWGVWHDAKQIADHISTRCKYASYHDNVSDNRAR